MSKAIRFGYQRSARSPLLLKRKNPENQSDMCGHGHLWRQYSPPKTAKTLVRVLMHITQRVSGALPFSNEPNEPNGRSRTALTTASGGMLRWIPNVSNGSFTSFCDVTWTSASPSIPDVFRRRSEGSKRAITGHPSVGGNLRILSAI